MSFPEYFSDFRPDTPDRQLDKHPFFMNRFSAGEVYLFHRTDPLCPAESSLWGVFDKRTENSIFLESSTRDLRYFRKWHKLPEGYCFSRLATRSELRDYTAGLQWFEFRRQPAVDSMVQMQ